MGDGLGLVILAAALMGGIMGSMATAYAFLLHGWRL